MMTDCYPILGGTSIEHLKENIQARFFFGRWDLLDTSQGSQDQIHGGTDEEAIRGLAV